METIGYSQEHPSHHFSLCANERRCIPVFVFLSKEDEQDGARSKKTMLRRWQTISQGKEFSSILEKATVVCLIQVLL